MFADHFIIQNTSMSLQGLYRPCTGIWMRMIKYGMRFSLVYMLKLPQALGVYDLKTILPLQGLYMRQSNMTLKSEIFVLYCINTI